VRRHTIPLILFALSFAPVLAARGAPQLTAAGPAFFRQISARCTSFGLLTDPAPALRRLLVSPAMKHVLVESKLAKLVAATGKPFPSPSKMVDGLYQHLFRIPAELALGTTPEGLESIARLFRCGVLVALSKAARAAGAEGAKDLATIQDKLAGELARVQLPEICVWIRLRRPAEAKSFLETATRGAQQLASRFGMEVEPGPDSVKLSLAVGAVYAEEQAASVLAALGVLQMAAEPAAEKLVRPLRAIRLEARVERKDETVRILLGTWKADGLPILSQKMGPLWTEGQAPYAFARWDISALREGLTRIDALGEEFGDGPVGRELAKMDNEDALGGLRRLARRVADTPTRGSARVEADPHLQFVMRQEIPRPPARLATAGIARFVPLDNEGFSASTEESVPQGWEAGLARFEDRLERERIKSELSGKSVRHAVAEAFASWWYTDMGALRKVILDSADAYFDREVAFVSRPATATSELTFDRRGELAGKIEVNSLPVPQAASIGKIRSGARISDLIEAFAKALAGGDKSKPKIVSADLGLGAPTWALAPGALETLPGNRGLKLAGDLVPHAVEVEGYLIMSTSVSLSRDLIATRKGGKSLAAPAELGESVSSYGVFTAKMVRAVLTSVAQWAAAGGLRVRATGSFAHETLSADLTAFGRGVEAFEDALTPFDRVEWWCNLAGDEAAMVVRLLVK
jgi:hypothetical protein